MAQPSDLLNPIPQAEPQEVNIDIQRAPAASNSQPEQIDPAFLGMMEGGQAQQQQQQQQQEIDPAFLQAMEPSPQPGVMPERMKIGEQDVLSEQPVDPGMMVSALEGLGRSPQEDALLLEKFLFGKGNVKLEGSNIFFKRPGEKKFSKLSSDHLEGLQWAKNAAAGLSGAVVETIAGGPVAALGAAAGAGLPGALATGGLAGAVGSGARDILVKGMLGKERDQSDVSTSEEMAYGAAFGAAGSSIGLGLSKLSSAFTKQFPQNRVQRIADIRSALNDFKKSIIPDYWNAEGQQVKKFAKAADYDEAISRTAQKLGQEVGAMRSEINARTAGQKFSMNNSIEALRGVLYEYEGRGIEFDEKTGEAIINPVKLSELGKMYKEFQNKIGPKTQVGQALEESIADEVIDQEKLFAPFGLEKGKSLMEQLVNTYNDMISRTNTGGFLASDVIDKAQQFQSMANFSQEIGTKNVYPWRKAAHAAVQDRHSVAASALGEEGLSRYLKTYSDYSNKIESVQAFESQIKKAMDTNSSSDLIDSIISKNNPKAYREFKTIVSPELGEEVKSNFVTKLIDKHIDDASGIFKADSFINDLKSYGPELVGSAKESGELLSQKEYRQLMYLASKMRKIKTSDLLSEKDVLTSLLNTPVIGAGSPTWWGRFIAKAVPPSKMNERALFQVIDEAIEKSPKSRVKNLLEMRDIVEDGWRLRSVKGGTGLGVSKFLQENISPSRSQQPTEVTK